MGKISFVYTFMFCFKNYNKWRQVVDISSPFEFQPNKH